MIDDALMSSQLLSPLHASAAMRAVMSDRARLQRMLDFEAALARAEAAVGVIPASCAGEIGDACRAERFDIAALAEAAIPSGHIAIAVVSALALEVARRNEVAAGFVHWGATSQDVVDTALMLELRAAIDALIVDLDTAIKGFTTLAGRHRRTLTVARTLMQHALPMPFGLKLAGYAASLARSRDRLARLRHEALVLQFGGAAGTLAALGEHGLGVSERLAALLDLQLPDAPWHSHRDRLAEVAAAFAILAGTCGKIARDVTLMMQQEVGEVFEPAAPGRGVSSTMPHKRNPTVVAAALSAATMAPNLAATILAAQVQEYERGVGGWQTEWLTFPALALVTSGALTAVAQIAEGLEIDTDRLRANLELSGGQIMAEAVSYALAEKIGRPEAHLLVRELSQQAETEKRPFKELLAADPRVTEQLSSLEIEKLFNPLTYQGSAQIFIDRLVVATQTRAVRRPGLRTVAPRTPAAPQFPPNGTADAGTPPPSAVVDHEPSNEIASAAQSPAITSTPGAESPAPALALHITPTEIAKPPPVDEDAPGGLMDVLSRAQTEIEAQNISFAAGKSKSP